MFSKILKAVIVLAVFRLSGSQSSGNDNSTKTVYLSDVAPQGILRIGFSFGDTVSGGAVARNDDCNYLIKSQQINPMSNDDKRRNAKIGLSVGALGLELDRGASIEIIPRSPSNSETDKQEQRKSESCRWTSSVSFYPKKVKEECMTTTTEQDLCIRLVGDWSEGSKSKASLLLTFYYEKSDTKIERNSQCPIGTVLCKCNGYNYDDEDDSSEEDNRRQDDNRRCVPQDLLCNGVSNCGLDCDHDEIISCNNQVIADPNAYLGPCTWTKFEYFAMMSMSGLLLILIPIVFCLTVLHHRQRRRALQHLQGIPVHYDGNNNQATNLGRYPHVISTQPVQLDNPPSYDDLPEAIKVPVPPSSTATTSQPQQTTTSTTTQN